MPDHEHEWGEAIADANVFDDAPDDVGSLPDGEAGMLPDRWRLALTIQL
jgi:hypothetical protein